MARKREERPVQIMNYFVYDGRVLPIEAMSEADRCKALTRATLPAMRAMNPGWTVEPKSEVYEIDLEGYFRNAPSVGSLMATEEAARVIEEQYARG